MSSWDDYRLRCVHGVLEGIDSHDNCSRCWELTRQKYGSDTPCYLWHQDPEYEKKSGTS